MKAFKQDISTPAVSSNEGSTLVVRLDGFFLLGEDWSFIPYSGSCLLSGLDIPNATFIETGVFKGCPQFEKMQALEIPLWLEGQLPGPLYISWVGTPTNQLKKTPVYTEFQAVIKKFINDSIMTLPASSPTRRNRRYCLGNKETIRICSQEDWLELSNRVCSAKLKEVFLNNRILKTVFHGASFVYLMSYELGQSFRVPIGNEVAELKKLFQGTEINKCCLVGFHWAFDWKSITSGPKGSKTRFFDIKKIQAKLITLGIKETNMNIYSIGFLPCSHVGNIQVGNVPSNLEAVGALNIYKRNGSDLKNNKLASFNSFSLSEFLDDQTFKIVDNFFNNGIIPSKREVKAPKGQYRHLLEEGGDTELSEINEILTRLQSAWKNDNDCRLEVVVWHKIPQNSNLQALYQFAKDSMDNAKKWLIRSKLFNPEDTLLEFSRVEINNWSEFVIQSCATTIENGIQLVRRIRMEPDLLTASPYGFWKWDSEVLVNLKCSEFMIGWFNRGSFEHTAQTEIFKKFLRFEELSRVSQNGEYIVELSHLVNKLNTTGAISVDRSEIVNLLIYREGPTKQHWTFQNAFFGVEKMRDVLSRPTETELSSNDFLRKLLRTLWDCLRVDSDIKPWEAGYKESYRKYQGRSGVGNSIKVVSIDTLLNRLSLGQQGFSLPFAASWYTHVRHYFFSKTGNLNNNQLRWDQTMKEILIEGFKGHVYPLVFASGKSTSNSEPGTSKSGIKTTAKEKAKTKTRKYYKRIVSSDQQNNYLMVIPLPEEMNDPSLLQRILTRTVAFQGKVSSEPGDWTWLKSSYEDLLPFLTNELLDQTMKILTLKYNEKSCNDIQVALAKLAPSISGTNAAENFRKLFES